MTAEHDYVALAGDTPVATHGVHLGTVLAVQQSAADARVDKAEAKAGRWLRMLLGCVVVAGLLAGAVVGLSVYLALNKPTVQGLVVVTPEKPVQLKMTDDGLLVGEMPLRVGWDAAEDPECVELEYEVGDGADKVRVTAHDGVVPVRIRAEHAGNLTVHVRAACKGWGAVQTQTPTNYYALRHDVLEVDVRCANARGLDCSDLRSGRLECGADIANATAVVHVHSEQCNVTGEVLSASAAGQGLWRFEFAVVEMKTGDDLLRLVGAARIGLPPQQSAKAAEGAEAKNSSSRAASVLEDVQKYDGGAVSHEMSYSKALGPLTVGVAGTPSAPCAHGALAVVQLLQLALQMGYKVELNPSIYGTAFVDFYAEQPTSLLSVEASVVKMNIYWSPVVAVDFELVACRAHRNPGGVLPCGDQPQQPL